MFPKLSRLKQGSILLFFNLVLSTFAFSFVNFFLKEQGFSLYHLVLLYFFCPLFAVVLTLLIGKHNFRFSFCLGYIAYGLVNLLLVFPLASFSLIGIAFFYSLGLVFFWIPLNYLFFEKSSNNTNAQDSSLYALIGPVLAMVFPLLGAVVIKKFGYSWLFGITSLLYLIPIIYVIKKIPKITLETRWRDYLPKFKGLKTITMLEGAFQFFVGYTIPIYALFYLKNATQVGGFVSYLSLLGLIVMLVISWHSDKKQKRISYLYTLFFLMAAAIISLILIKEVLFWFLAVGIFAVLSTISYPIRLAVSMDIKAVDLGFWRIRELFLNVGRAFFMGLTALLFYFEKYWVIFVVFALVAGTYPFLVKYKFKELK